MANLQGIKVGQEVIVKNEGRKNGFRGIVVGETKHGLFEVQHGSEGDEPLCYYAHELRSLPSGAASAKLREK